MKRRVSFILCHALAMGVLTLLPCSSLFAGVELCAQQNCDTNGDGGRDISDAIRIFGFLFLGDAPPVPFCPGTVHHLANGDCNGQNGVDLSDGVRLLSWLFGSLPPPVEEELDSDGDGVLDLRDNCPLNANAGQEDADQDSVGDACDACPGASDVVDGDADGFPDGCDNCRLAGNDQADFDGDAVGDVCDNCPQVTNSDQKDLDQDGIGDACQRPPSTYAGSLTATRGRWQYVPGMVGLAGGNNLCFEKFAGAQVCTYDQLLKASAVGELKGATDFSGKPVTTFWAHRPGTAGDHQCFDPSRENICWTYQTGHIAVGGEFISLNSDGLISEIQLLMDHCQGAHWVACCNP